MRNQGRKRALDISKNKKNKNNNLKLDCVCFSRKILHNIYPTSILLNKLGISNSKNCAFGCNQTDYPEHFFFSCKKISTIWEYVEEKVYRKFEIKPKLTVTDVLFDYKGHSQHFTMIQFVNHLILVAKNVCWNI